MFYQATTFDLVLSLSLAGEPVGNAETAAFGNGGLRSHRMAFRFPPYRPTKLRGDLQAKK